mgnify:CR=1 FL=1
MDGQGFKEVVLVVLNLVFLSYFLVILGFLVVFGEVLIREHNQAIALVEFLIGLVVLCYGTYKAVENWK